MFKVIATIVTAVAALFMFAGVASAEVTSQSTSESDHMESTSESTGPGRVLVVTGHSPYYKDGVQQFHENGDPIMLADFGWGSIGTGLAPATIVHN